MQLEEVKDRQVEVVATIEEHEVDRLGDVRQRMKRIAGAQLDEIGKTGVGEVLLCQFGLLRVALACDECSAATVADCGGKIDGGDAERATELDDLPRFVLSASRWRSCPTSGVIDSGASP
jgi:hypothetical protein